METTRYRRLGQLQHYRQVGPGFRAEQGKKGLGVGRGWLKGDFRVIWRVLG